jgi:tetratricopeptide (TPR) repeat protein
VIKQTFAIVCLGVWLWLMPVKMFGQSVELAKDYYAHNLNDKAKDILITLIHSQTSTSKAKSEALYTLGQISFDENRYGVALSDWKKLTKLYPQSPEAHEVSAQMAVLSGIMQKASETTLSSAVASAYIVNGDFWSKAGDTYMIDSSFLPRADLAIAWYNRVIQQFPGSDGAELAYQREMFALLGTPGSQTEQGTGVQADYKKYMPELLDTFTRYETAFPNGSQLQAFRYQIAQVYWSNRDWANTQLWLQKVIDNGKGVQTFYTEAAKARLTKVKY